MIHARSRVVLAAALCCASLPVLADDDAWHGSLGFDAWLFVVDGSLTVRGNEAFVHTSFKDTVDLLAHIDSLFAGSGEIGKGRYRLLLDGMHLDFEIPENRGNVDLKLEHLEGAFAYRASGDATGADGYIDVLAGARWFNMELGVRGGGPLGLGVSGEKDTVQPFLGFRGDNRVSEHMHLNYRADFGGFQHEDNSIQLYGGFTYRCDNGWFLNTGVRALSLNFDEGSGDTRFSHRLRYVGPQLGGGFGF
jgi:hypothetical protein